MKLSNNPLTSLSAGVSAALLLTTASVTADAGQVDIPHTFQANTRALAGEVNANFTAIESAVDGNAGDIVRLQQEIAELRAALETLQGSATGDLAQRVSEIEQNSVLALDGYVVMDNNDGIHVGPVVRFQGVNLQVVNGTGSTAGEPNGLGNLIIGYDATNASIPNGAPVDMPQQNPGQVPLEICSIGKYGSEEDTCISNGGTYALDHKSGSHNLVIGDYHQYSQFGGIVAGWQNSILSKGANVTGGTHNKALSLLSSVVGGTFNSTDGVSSAILGGTNNSAEAIVSTVSGGRNNRSFGLASVVSGGNNNQAEGSGSSVTGGFLNEARGTESVVTGGYRNIAFGDGSSVTGGADNRASGLLSSVSAGNDNTSLGNYSSISGGIRNKTDAVGTTIGGGRNRDVSTEYAWRAGNLFQSE